MESIENKMSAGSKDKVNFFTHVFEFNETNKDLMLKIRYDLNYIDIYRCYL